MKTKLILALLLGSSFLQGCAILDKDCDDVRYIGIHEGSSLKFETQYHGIYAHTESGNYCYYSMNDLKISESDGTQIELNADNRKPINQASFIDHFPEFSGLYHDGVVAHIMSEQYADDVSHNLVNEMFVYIEIYDPNNDNLDNLGETSVKLTLQTE